MKSAQQIGKSLGFGAQTVNKILKDMGLLNGEPGKYSLTDLGKEVGELRKKTNGYGGYAKREWSFHMWDDLVIDQIKKHISR